MAKDSQAYIPETKETLLDITVVVLGQIHLINS